MAVNKMLQHRCSLKLRVLTQGARILASAMVTNDSAQLLQPNCVFPTKTETCRHPTHFSSQPLSPLQQSKETSLHTDQAVSACLSLFLTSSFISLAPATSPMASRCSQYSWSSWLPPAPHTPSPNTGRRGHHLMPSSVTY